MALSGEPTLEELCALSVKDVWYPLGLWLGVEEERLRKMKVQPGSVNALFTTFLQFPVGSQKYSTFLDKLSYDKQRQVIELIKTKETNNFRDFIQHLPEEQITLATEIIDMMNSKNTLLVRALVKVGKRNVAEKICSKKGVSLTDYLDATDPASNPPDCVLRYASYLKDRYKQMSVLPDPDWPPAIASKDHYTNLALIQQERSQHPRISDMHKMAKDYAHGQIDTICARKQYIQLVEAFYPIINPDTSYSRLTILIDGAPGVGKTTITRKLCIDWAEGTMLQEYLLVILVPLREMKITHSEHRTIADLMPADDLTLKEQVTKHLKETSGANTLIIFDGFDELSSEQRKMLQDSLFLDIIRGSRLHRCSVLATSRPYASGPLRGLNRVNRHVEVSGFTEDQIADCVSQNLPEEEVKQLLQALDHRLDIGSLCYIPLNCKIVLYVYTQEDFKLPATLTELYEIFILHTIKHYAPQITSDSLVMQEIKEARNLHSLPDSVLLQLSDLSNFAFSGMEEGNLVFDHSTLIRASRGHLSLGLMTSLHCFSTTGVLEHFQFLHLTIQEFLAARHVASDAMSTEEKRQFLKTNIVNERFRMTLLFLAGLTQFMFLQPNEPLLEDQTSYLSGDDCKERLLFLAQLLYESKSSSVRILTTLNSRLDMSGHHLTKFDCLVLAYFLSATPKDHVWEEINFAGCDLTSFSILFTQKHLANFNFPAIAMTKRLILASRRIDDNASISIPTVTSILSASSTLPLEKLQLEMEGIADCKHVVEFSRALANHHNLLAIDCGVLETSKRVLFRDYSAIKICSKSFQEMLIFLTADEVREINLYSHPEAFEDCSKCWSYGRDAVQSLCEILSRSKCIQTVNLDQCKLSDEAAVSVIASLSDQKSQVDVNMEGSEVSTSGLVNILNNLSINVHCRILGMKFHIDEDMLLHLHYHSDSNVHLTSLTENIPSRLARFGIDVNHISDELVESLIQASKSIEYLKLNYLELTDSSVVPKLQILLSHISPKELHFLHCEVFRQIGYDPELTPVTQAIQTMLETNKSLQVLTLSHCGINDIVISHLAAGLTHNTTLLELAVSENRSITSHGWVQLFNALKLGPTHLQKLDISGNNLDPESISALNEMPCFHQTLTTLRLQDCSIDDHSLETLVGGLKTLREIIIRENKGITSKGWIPLFQALQSTSINTLDISYNELGDEGLSSLREFLHHNETITVFRAHGCGLTDDVVEEIADSFSHNSSLSELDISWNHHISSECWIQLLQALHQNMSLRKLDIHQFFWDDRRRVVRALSEMIACNKGITELSIMYYFIEDEYELLARALLQNTTLQILTLTSEEDVQALKLEIDRLKEEKTHVGEVSPDWNLRIVKKQHDSSDDSSDDSFDYYW